MKLLKHANVYTPAPLGKRDVLIEGERILRIAEEITGYDELPDVDVYDLSGKTLVPAYIDLHVHITGGGGEQGPASRVPESSLSTFFKNGIRRRASGHGRHHEKPREPGGEGPCTDRRRHDGVYIDLVLWLPADDTHRQRRAGHRSDPTDDRCEGRGI